MKKSLVQLCAMLVLTVTLAMTAFAGEIGTTAAPGEIGTTHATTAGEIGTTVTLNNEAIQIALTFFQWLP